MEQNNTNYVDVCDVDFTYNLKDDLDYIVSHYKGDYIQLGGRGILDGIKLAPCKMGVYKIIGMDDDGGLIVKAYRARGCLVIPQYNQDQQYQIITSKDWRKLPEY